MFRKKSSIKRILGNSRLSLRFSFVLFGLSLSIGTIAFVLIEDYGFWDAFYMSVITLSTVGFSEIHTLSPAGRIFVSFYIIFNVGIFTYALSAISAYVLQGNLLKNMNLKRMENRIKKLSGHVIICGLGRHGREVVEHFEKHTSPYVIIDKNEEKIAAYVNRVEPDNLLFIVGDATEDEILEKANIQGAAHIIAALPDDTENLYVVLTARGLAPDINIISRFSNPRSEKKLRMAGANKVLMPEQIGGFYMATMITKPGAIDFLSYLGQGHAKDVGLEEIRYKSLPPEWKGKSLKEMHVRDATGANIISLNHADGKIDLNPEPDSVLEPGGSYIVLGNNKQLSQLKEMLIREI